MSLLLTILLVAAILRLGWPGITEFKADEARLLALAWNMAEGKGLAVRGISSSVGFPNFPMSVWLYAVPLLFWKHVYSATLFTGILNTVAVLACYWLVRRYWGVQAALAMALLFSVSPWAVIFSRKIWAQNLLPLFVVGWGIGAALALVERRSVFIWLHLICLAIVVQIHLAALALVPASLLLLFIFRRRVKWSDVLLGGALGLLTAAPFITYLWSNRHLLTGGRAVVDSGGVATLEAWRLTAMLSLGAAIHSLAGPEKFADYLRRVPDASPVYWLWGALICAGIAVLVWRLWRHLISRQEDKMEALLPPSISLLSYQAEVGVIVLLWLLAPPFFFTWHNTPLFLHYFIAILPAVYIVAGIAFSQVIHYVADVRHSLWHLTAISGWLVLLATAVIQISVWGILLAFVEKTATPGGFGIPLVLQLEAAEEAQQLFRELEAAEVVIAGPGESPRVDEFPAVYDVLLRNVPHRFVDINRSALFPATPTVVLLAGDDGLAELYLGTAAQRSSIAMRVGEGNWHILALEGKAAPLPEVEFEPPYLLANWVNVLGYDKPRITEGETAVWQIHWRTGSNADPNHYQFFNHLIDGQRQRVSQVDGPAFAPQQWREGDVVVSRFLLTWPDSLRPPLTMRIGMYTYPELTPVLLLDIAGNPYSDAVEIVLCQP